MRLRQLVILIFAGVLSACGSRPLLPSVEEESQLLASADLGSGKKYAVVTESGFATRKVPDVRLAQPIANDVADVAAEMLGLEAVALDQSQNAPWARELVESWDNAGFFETISHHDFFADLGFDGYIIVLLESEGIVEDFTLGQQRSNKPSSDPFGRPAQLTQGFSPQFRIYQLVDGDTKPLMRSGIERSFSCQLQTGPSVSRNMLTFNLSDWQACSTKFVDLFRQHLRQRMPESFPVD